MIYLIYPTVDVEKIRRDLPKAAVFVPCAFLVLGKIGSEIRPRGCTILPPGCYPRYVIGSLYE